jgi:hypothetical protein
MKTSCAEFGKYARSKITDPRKVKVKLSLCLTKHHAMKTYRGSVGIPPRILDLGTRWK